jgi:hypothetical protein
MSIRAQADPRCYSLAVFARNLTELAARLGSSIRLRQRRFVIRAWGIVPGVQMGAKKARFNSYGNEKRFQR